MKTKKIAVCVSLPSFVVSDLEKYSGEMYRTKSSLVSEALQEYFNRIDYRRAQEDERNSKPIDMDRINAIFKKPQAP